MSCRLAVAVLMLSACAAQPQFVCMSNVDCVSETGDQGICETDGSCSFADSTCPTTNRRYPDGAAPELASACLAPVTSCVSQLAVGSSHSCALRTDGTVWCWGSSDAGQVGVTGDRAEPTQVQQLPNGHAAMQIAAGENFTCALMDDGTVWCWGDNGSLQLGVCMPTPPETSARPLEAMVYTNPTSPVCGVGVPLHATQISVGGQHVCALGTDEALYCWGENQVGSHGGQSGQNPAMLDDVPGPMKVAFDGAVQVQVGDEYSCVVKDEHSVWCFGANTLGELGIGDMTDSFVPANVVGLGDAETLVADDETACVQTRDGGLWCWGNGASGLLGTDLSHNVLSPIRIGSATAAFGGGTSETICVGQNNGVLECFGANDSGQAGIDGAADITTPSAIPLITVTMASLGADHSCAVTSDGAIWCWGDNTHGQLGTGTMDPEPVTVPIRAKWTCP
jgi:alpha-tubulin suppressor-like RCC1 family protein